MFNNEWFMRDFEKMIEPVVPQFKAINLYFIGGSEEKHGKQLWLTMPKSEL
jgi:hypothetical protein